MSNATGILYVPVPLVNPHTQNPRTYHENQSQILNRTAVFVRSGSITTSMFVVTLLAFIKIECYCDKESNKNSLAGLYAS